MMDYTGMGKGYLFRDKYMKGAESRASPFKIGLTLSPPTFLPSSPGGK